MRADARRNRERIIEAARTVLAVSGSDAQMDEVAAAAGVGVGTVYRHFPTKDALLAELVTQKFQKIAAMIEEAEAEAAAGRDPGEALLASLERGAGQMEADLALQHVLSGANPAVMNMCVATVSGVNLGASRLISAGKATGTLRPDMAVEDIRLMMGGLASTMSDPGTRDHWPRYLRLMLDALRAPGARD